MLQRDCCPPMQGVLACAWTRRSDPAGRLSCWRVFAKAVIGVGARPLEAVWSCVGVVPTVGPKDLQSAVGQQLDRPLPFVHGVMVAAAKRDEVVEIGRAAVFPFGDVVRLTPADGTIAVGPGAVGVDTSKCDPLAFGGRAVSAANVDRPSIGVESQRAHIGVAAESADGLESELSAVDSFANRVLVGAVEHRVGIDHDRDVRPALSTVAVRDQLDQRQSVEVRAKGELVAIGLGLLCQPGGFPSDAVGENGGEFGIELAPDLLHAIAVGPAAELRGRPLLLRRGQAVVVGDSISQLAYLPVERVDRRVVRAIDEVASALIKEWLEFSLDVVAGSAESVDVFPADTAFVERIVDFGDVVRCSRPVCIGACGPIRDVARAVERLGRIWPGFLGCQLIASLPDLDLDGGEGSLTAADLGHQGGDVAGGEGGRGETRVALL